jgi:hypothetical protein
MDIMDTTDNMVNMANMDNMSNMVNMLLIISILKITQKIINISIPKITHKIINISILNITQKIINIHSNILMKINIRILIMEAITTQINRNTMIFRSLEVGGRNLKIKLKDPMSTSLTSQRQLMTPPQDSNVFQSNRTLPHLRGRNYWNAHTVLSMSATIPTPHCSSHSG